ncbi:MAG: nucleotide exchange factor GrpE [Ignavibacteria bacterium]|nr:nucleotide exchange factor GrpE [Ignavibacteria bacterium]
MTKNKKDKKDKMKEEAKGVEIPINVSGDSTAETNTTAEANADTTASAEEIKIKELEAKLSAMQDQYLRKAAEFDNYKRRTDAEKAEFFAYASERLMGELLPVLDDFDRTMDSFDKNHDAEALKKGIDIVYDKFRAVLAKQGLKIMDSNGKPFDVNLHEAILQQPSADAEPDTVLDTVEKGYYMKDKVLRHAKVIVSAKPE